MFGSGCAATQLASTGFTGVTSQTSRDPKWSDGRRRMVGLFVSYSKGQAEAEVNL